jgi:hypothetical protein
MASWRSVRLTASGMRLRSPGEIRQVSIIRHGRSSQRFTPSVPGRGALSAALPESRQFGPVLDHARGQRVQMRITPQRPFKDWYCGGALTALG